MRNIFVEMFYRDSSCSIVNKAFKYLSLEGFFESGHRKKVFRGTSVVFEIERNLFLMIAFVPLHVADFDFYSSN
jgi:hypothetical protein